MKRKANTDPVEMWIKAAKKKLKKKAFRMKAKIILSVVLPGLIVLLGTAAARIFLRMALRRAGSGIKAGPREKTHKKEHKSGILEWPAHEDAAEKAADSEGAAEKTAGPKGTEVSAAENAAGPEGAAESSTAGAGPETTDTECAGTTDAAVTVAADQPAQIKPEPVVLESSRPEFVTPEAVQTELPTAISENGLSPRREA